MRYFCTKTSFVLAAIIYRVLRYQEKFQVKLIHAGLHAAAFVFIVIGLCAVFDFHNNKNIPNVYSLHSWIGIGTTVLFACQVSIQIFYFVVVVFFFEVALDNSYNWECHIIFHSEKLERLFSKAISLKGHLAKPFY